ncbi:MAG TPA: error-prone DNA polymerase, partial [Solirubrobacteraceae bacterium]|nr:error-prone DNA polymerase [Solirubrobacteraceae bacterium]
SLDDIVIQVAIVRPGPIQGGAINPYIDRRRRLREDPSYEVPYDHPSLRPILSETLGTIIFQDQVMEVAEAFAGFTPGEADGLRRAMSRKRAGDMLARQRERFIEGALRHRGDGAHAPPDRATAERVWQMVEGFAGFGFPKAHSAAFGLLAYQSTWLRVHYGAEFLCALLNEQPMGFYAPDSLAHEAQLRGIELRGVDVNDSDVQCTVQGGAVRLGLRYVKGAPEAELAALVAERRRSGPFGSLAELAARSGATRTTLEQLAWAGACDRLAEDGQRRTALWQLGVAAPARGLPDADEADSQQAQLALPLELAPAPALRPLGRWQRLIADYFTTTVTLREHALAILRPRLTVPMLATSAQLERLPGGGEVAVAGLVIARQRPATASGTMFLLFEDEFGTINLIVPEQVYERYRRLARTEPLLLARGRLERTQEPTPLHGSATRTSGAPAVAGTSGSTTATGEDADGLGPEQIRPVINVVVRELASLEHFLDGGLEGPEELPGGDVRHLRRPPAAGEQQGAEEPAGEEVASSMRAAAPAVQSFAMGRRR